MPAYPAAYPVFPAHGAQMDDPPIVHNDAHLQLEGEVLAMTQELGLNPSGIHATVVARISALESQVNSFVASEQIIGQILAYGGDTAPAGWLLCRGQLVARATYPELFAVIGTKFGAGDGVNTFAVPAFQGRSPMGYYPGGAWAAAGVGEMLGSANQSLLSHSHGVNINSGNISADHTHSVSGATGLVNANHNHNINAGEVYTHTLDPVNNVDVFGVRVGDGVQINMRRTNTYVMVTGIENQDHAHTVSGGTGGVSANHQHNVSGSTAAAGGAGTNENLSPSVVVNFIIRATP